MANTRISDLPVEATPSASDVVPIDGATTRQTTIADLVDAGRPMANQATAEAGVSTTTAMNPLATKQSIAIEVGATLQAYSANLDEYAAVDPTSAGLALLDDADAEAQRTTMGVAIGTDVQAFSTHLAAVVALDKTDGGFVVTDGTTFVVESGSTARASLGLGTSATVNTGTSGATIPLLNTAVTWSANPTVAPASGNAVYTLNKAASGTANNIFGQTGGVNRWVIQLGNSVAETGSNAGSDFSIINYNDAGVAQGTPMTVSRNTGIPVFAFGATVGDASGDPVIIKGTTVHSFSSALLSGADAATWKTALSIGAGLNHIAGGWVTATGYSVDDWLTHNGVAYLCISAHTSGASTEPGIGASWATVWEANPFGTLSVSNVTNSQLANVAEATFKGRQAGAGTGSPQDMTASQARTAMGVVIGTDVQAYDADLQAIAGLAKTDGNFIVADGAAWGVESGATARASLGLGSAAVKNTGTSGDAVPLLNTANTFSGAQTVATSTLTDGATITPNLALSNDYALTLGGNRTLANPTNRTVGQWFSVTVTQDGTGSRTLTYGSHYKFPGGVAPTLTTTASAYDTLTFRVKSATEIQLVGIARAFA